MYIEHPMIRPESIDKRDYQVNIAEACKKQSTLVVLPTGMGKTICALLLIAHRLVEYPHDKILFLAPTKPLVEQHKAFIDDYLMVDPDKTAIFTGEVSPKKRTEQWKNSQIIVSTPQVIENDLLASRIKLDDISLVIFDESHRAVGNYAYVFVAEQYRKQGKNQLVLGITASPGNQAKKIMEVCNTLNISGVEIRSEFDPDVMPYIHDIKITWVRVDLPDKVKLINKQLRKILEQKCKTLYKFGLIRRFRKVSTTELLEAQKKIQGRMIGGKKQPNSLFFAATVQAAAIKINHAIELAETQGPSALRNYLDRLEVEANTKGGSRASKSLLKDKDLLRAIKLAENTGLENPKLKSVALVVKEQIDNKPDSKIIVFTHYRDTSELVVKELAKIPGVKPVRFVGQASHGADKGLTQKEQVALIQKFKAGEFNVLVATSVAEEGLDIPATDLVVFYEPIPSEIRTIQRRGRTGRNRPGKVIILITRESRDEAYYWSSRGKEKRMKSELEILKNKLADKLTVGQSKPITKIFPTVEPKVTLNLGIPERVPENIEPPLGQNITPIDTDKDLGVTLAPGQMETVSQPVSVTTNAETEPVITGGNTVISDIDINKIPTTEGQTKLIDFPSRWQGLKEKIRSEPAQKIRIIVDNREFKSSVVRELAKRDVTIEPQQLPVGDYIISDRICVERKLVSDFLQSLIDGRLFVQLKKIKEEYQSAIMILEGEGLFTSRKINSSAIYGALASIISDFHIPIISTASAIESAELVRTLAAREQLENKRLPEIRGEKHAMSLPERQRFIIESLPNVSAILAHRLLEKFGTVSAIFSAKIDELTKVKGVGKRTAKEIKDAIEKEYPE